MAMAQSTINWRNYALSVVSLRSSQLHATSTLTLASVYSLSVVRLAVYAVILDETGRLSVQCQLTHAAAQAVWVPRTSIHLQQVFVGDWFRARRTHPVLRLHTHKSIMLRLSEAVLCTHTVMLGLHIHDVMLGLNIHIFHTQWYHVSSLCNLFIHTKNVMLGLRVACLSKHKNVMLGLRVACLSTHKNVLLRLRVACLSTQKCHVRSL